MPYAINAMAIWRFDSNGNLDTSFNNVGYVTHHSAADDNTTLNSVGRNDNGRGLVIDNQNRIVVAGESFLHELGTNPAVTALSVWRYLENGQPDKSVQGTVYFTRPKDIAGEGVGITFDKLRNSVLVTGMYWEVGFKHDMFLMRIQ